jgi:anti-sigma-K factor RskA
VKWIPKKDKALAEKGLGVLQERERKKERERIRTRERERERISGWECSVCKDYSSNL